MRRLERVYSVEAVRAEYDQLKTAELGRYKTSWDQVTL